MNKQTRRPRVLIRTIGDTKSQFQRVWGTSDGQWNFFIHILHFTCKET